MPCSLRVRAPRPRGGRFHGTSPGSAGRWPASPGNRAWRRVCGPAARAPRERQRRALFPACPGTEAAGWTLPRNEPRERGPPARIPGEPRLAARVRAGGPRSQGAPTSCLVPCVSGHRGRGVDASAERAPGARAAGPHPRGTAPGGACAGRRPALPGSANVVPCSLRVRAPRPRGGRFHGTSPGSTGRWPASPGNRAWRRVCGPAARAPRERQRRALFPACPGTEAAGWTLPRNEPRERGPPARIHGEPRLAARVRAAGPRSRRGPTMGLPFPAGTRLVTDSVGRAQAPELA